MAQTKSIPQLASTRNSSLPRPTREEAEAAVRTLIAWAGEDPDRAGLHNTPSRVIEAYEEYFRGYNEDPTAWLSDDNIDLASTYSEPIILTGVRVQSFCEHHMTPFEGTAGVAYLPNHRFVGLSRLARVVDTCARRLQTQESLTQQISQSIDQGLSARGVAVLIEAEHQCMSFRGIRQSGIKTVTTHFTGEFESNPVLREHFLSACDQFRRRS